MYPGNISGRIFPTPVGMVRVLSLLAPPLNDFPHARGDGPKTMKNKKTEKQFSPRPWGWSGGGMVLDQASAIFPTPVGMVH